MSDYRTVGASVTNAMPAWRQAMASVGKLYAVGPASVNAALGPSWPGVPGGVVPPRFQLRGVGNDNQVHFGWNASVLLPDLGTHGKLVYLGSGENYWGNDSTAFDLGTAQWEWWQGPDFCRSEAEAAARDADAYYDPTYAVFGGSPPANRTFAENETWYALWDKGFPVAHGGWIYRRKFTSNSHGDNRHWAGRYNMAAVVPKQFTGTGRAAITVNSHSWRGPFVSPSPGSYRPFSDWFADCAPPSGGEGSYTGFPRGVVFWQDVNSKAWSQVTPRTPDYVRWDPYESASFFDEYTGRTYYFSQNKGALYYVDFSGGMAGATMSGLATLSVFGNGAATFQDYTSICFTNNHPQGRRLAFMKAHHVPGSVVNTLIMFDLDTGRYYGLGPIPGLQADRSGFTDVNLHTGITYVAERNALVLTTKSLDRGAETHVIPLPTDPTVASNYSATTTALTLDTGVSLESGGGSQNANIYMYGQGKGGYIPAVDCVMTPQRNGPLLAYRPPF